MNGLFLVMNSLGFLFDHSEKSVNKYQWNCIQYWQCETEIIDIIDTELMFIGMLLLRTVPVKSFQTFDWYCT